MIPRKKTVKEGKIKIYGITDRPTGLVRKRAISKRFLLIALQNVKEKGEFYVPTVFNTMAFT